MSRRANVKEMGDLVIVQDQREKDPFSFDGVPTVVAFLRSGDYSIQGCESEFAIERKRPGELFGNFGLGRKTFEREIKRLSEMRYAAIVVEGSFPECDTKPNGFSRVPPSAVGGSLLSWGMRYGVHTWFADDRRHAQALTLRLLQNYFRWRNNLREVPNPMGEVAEAVTHHAMVSDALMVFPGAKVLVGDAQVEADFQAFKALAGKHFPGMAPLERMEASLDVIQDIAERYQAVGVLGALPLARVREVWAKMEALRDRLAAAQQQQSVPQAQIVTQGQGQGQA